MVDFTSCRVYNKSYAGANGSKLCIDYNDEKYMLKFPSLPTKTTELSYANGCVSEYIGCHLYELAGIPVQKTILGTYTKNGKEKIVVACKDFTDIGIVLQDFGSIKNQIIDSEHNGYGTELSDIMKAIEKQTAIDPSVLKKRFWDMFAMDALLGNFDRHNGNWGLLYNQMTDQLSLAPVYDCGSCLFPQADKETILKILNNTGELHTRIYNFPTSAIKIDNKKIPYYSFLTTTDDIDCLLSVKEVYEHFDLDTAIDFINGIEMIDDLQKTFYCTMLNARYELILTPAYERALDVLNINNPTTEIEPENYDDLEDDGYDPAD